MNKQEERVITVLNTRIPGIVMNSGIYAIRSDKVAEVAHEITAIFQQQKDTRSQRERILDTAFVLMGVKPRICHFTEAVFPFSAITIASYTWYKADLQQILDTIFARNALWIRGCSPATQVLRELRAVNVYGVSICDKSDVFSKCYGRMKAKGKLMQHLLKETKKTTSHMWELAE